MKSSQSARREFLWSMGSTAGAAWLAANMPAIAAAAQRAHEAASAKQAVGFEILTAEQAKDVAAIAARIIPTDEDPGATEAGVVFFIDRALKTFAKEDRATYKIGLEQVNQLTAKMVPEVTQFSSATLSQQDQIIEALAKTQKAGGWGRRRMMGEPVDFFPVIWGHTLMGFLVDPEGGGNRDYAGWKVIGRDPAHIFSPPFGEYDKDYPGWQVANSAETEKK